ncbi:protein lin-54 homolog isoform X2 [Mizuhopecten yessoensis]|uniref:protein lin-54 homolog isoform X2 n=1 Tax=Mizuhopecten yessoensis TaxID=6573 RepID=UPI000B4588D5|nr:protein lin-54 homolog isoform X2 [Mizuhopecten yessoensis]
MNVQLSFVLKIYVRKCFSVEDHQSHFSENIYIIATNQNLVISFCILLRGIRTRVLWDGNGGRVILNKHRMPAQRTGIGNNEAFTVVTVASDGLNTSSVNSLEGIASSSKFVDIPTAVDYEPIENLETPLDTFVISSTPEIGGVETVLVEGQPPGSVVLPQNDSVASNVQQPEIIYVSQPPAAKPTPEVFVVSQPSATKAVTTIKRPLSGSGNSPVVTKVIITKNPNTSQPQAMPIQLNQVLGQTMSLSSMGQGINIIPQGSQTPTKTITISPQGIVSASSMKLTTMSSPGKVGIPVRQLPMSPTKTPTKITMIPVSVGKSPQRIAPAAISMLAKNPSEPGSYTPVTISSTTGNTVTVSRPTVNMITMSPSKVLKQGTVLQSGQTLLGSNPQIITQGGVKQMAIPMSSVHSVQGSKFQYLRLVAPSSQGGKTAGGQLTSVVHGIPVSNSGTVSLGQHGGQQMKITLPLQGSQLKTVVSQAGSAGVHRILLPAQPNQVRLSTGGTTTSATTLQQIRPASSASLGQLPPGATILSAGNSAQGLQGFALVPASYLSQMQQAPAKPVAPVLPPEPQVQQSRQDYIAIASNDPSISANAMARNSVNGLSPVIEPTGARPRKPCNCTKSQCLKLYCDCFANGEFCHNCNCNNCANNLEHEEERSKAIKSCLDRNPMAFHPKIGKGREGNGDRRHNKGCNCKRSGCLKNYCECYEAKIMCSNHCKCVGCKNFEESPERKTLMHLADAAEVRVQQQTAAKSKLSSQISGIPSRPPVSSATGERLPYTFITAEVAEATCACLLAQAEEAERLKMPPVVQERMVIEEFGRCLLQIIDSANKTKDIPQESDGEP